MKRLQFANYKAEHFIWQVSGKVATITINRPDRKNPLTLESYNELRELFHGLSFAADIKAVVVLCQEDARASCCARDEGGPFGAVL
jgi:enoyl-CoA hydratase/carnithine racemase